MNKILTCIECPKSCALSVDIENCRVIRISGNECPRGKDYAVSEIENPLRVLTSAVLAEGLCLKMVPVRTDKPLPKSRIFEAIDQIRKIKIDKPVSAGDVIKENLLGLGVNLIATRGAQPRL